MLDFGTDMTPREDQESGDDLFAGLTGNKLASERAEKIENKTPDIAAAADSETAKPKRPQIKPPTLPKYQQPAALQAREEAILPSLRNNPHFLHRRRKAEDFSSEDKKEVSRILKEARKSSGLSIESVEKSTQIRAHYIVALEEADYDNLPQPVYVLAYLRKLCNIYNISEEEENNLIRPWRNIPCELPENLNTAVQLDEDNNNRQVLYRIEIILLAVGALIVIGVITLIIVLIVSYFSGKDLPQTSFENSRVLELQEMPVIDVPEQPRPGTSGR
ncbi:MAG: helix-turn-helix domain-containing protein [Lentisphaeria bacterium]|nr:helix-turn-helix domain-containing protein [Lentisphaeria bacterium]